MDPILAVVIPIYNTELYLEDCLESIANQTYSNIDVVLVNNGSTDGSMRIAEKFVAADDRFRLLHHARTAPGPGAARNTGIRHIASAATYIAFADSDDVLPNCAYSSLVGSLESSGSDIAAGNVFRINAKGSFSFDKLAGIFKETRIGSSIRDVPDLVIDRPVWNKVYRRSFWDHHALLFPEGIVYDDSPVTVPLYYLAETVDLLSEVVYHWRIRDQGLPSITQRRTISAMLDRFKSIDLVRAFLQAELTLPPESVTSYDRNVLSEELPLFFNELVEASPDHRDIFIEKANDVLSQISADLIAELPESLRSQYSAIRDRRKHDLMQSLCGHDE